MLRAHPTTYGLAADLPIPASRTTGEDEGTARGWPGPGCTSEVQDGVCFSVTLTKGSQFIQ